MASDFVFNDGNNHALIHVEAVAKNVSDRDEALRKLAEAFTDDLEDVEVEATVEAGQVYLTIHRDNGTTFYISLRPKQASMAEEVHYGPED